MSSLVEDSGNQSLSPQVNDEDRIVGTGETLHPPSQIDGKDQISKRVRKQRHAPPQMERTERIVDTVMQKDGTRKMILTEEQYEHLPSDLHRLVVDVLVRKGEWVIIKRHSSSMKDGNTK
jgi:hypothetical protein